MVKQGLFLHDHILFSQGHYHFQYNCPVRGLMKVVTYHVKELQLVRLKNLHLLAVHIHISFRLTQATSFY